MIEGIIYCYHSPSNKYYIGQTIHESKRRRQHIQLSNTGDNAYFHKAIRKHGFENLYNTCQGRRGGGNMTGKHFSEESKEKMRKSHLGHKQSNKMVK